MNNMGQLLEFPGLGGNLASIAPNLGLLGQQQTAVLSQYQRTMGLNQHNFMPITDHPQATLKQGDELLGKTLRKIQKQLWSSYASGQLSAVKTLRKQIKALMAVQSGRMSAISLPLNIVFGD